MVHYALRIGPIAFAAVSVDSRPGWLDSALNQVVHPRTWQLPRFPDTHSDASAKPLVEWFKRGFHIRRLPSDSVSRRTPLPLAVTFSLSGRSGDLHPLEYVRAGRTTKAPWSESRGPDRFRSQSRRLRLTATGRGSGHALGAAALHPQSGNFAFTRDAFRGNVCLYG